MRTDRVRVCYLILRSPVEPCGASASWFLPTVEDSDDYLMADLVVPETGAGPVRERGIVVLLSSFLTTVAPFAAALVT